MLWFHLLRVRCEPLKQASLFQMPRSPGEVIIDTIRATPTAVVGRGSEWHIGKPESVGANALGFKMGRTTAVSVPKYDVETHDFFESQVDSAPYTFGVFDQYTQACGILKKSGVSQVPAEISNKLEKLLNSTSIPEQAGYRAVVDPISDPEGFLEQLRSADTITKFSFTASFENPFDVDRLIQRPAEKFTGVVGGTRTKVEVEGESLNEEVLEELSRGVAATGEAASATVRSKGARRGKRIHLRGNPVLESVETEKTSIGLYKSIHDAVLKSYNRVRNAL